MKLNFTFKIAHFYVKIFKENLFKTYVYIFCHQMTKIEQFNNRV